MEGPGRTVCMCERSGLGPTTAQRRSFPATNLDSELPRECCAGLFVRDGKEWR